MFLVNFEGFSYNLSPSNLLRNLNFLPVSFRASPYVSSWDFPIFYRSLCGIRRTLWVPLSPSIVPSTLGQSRSLSVSPDNLLGSTSASEWQKINHFHKLTLITKISILNRQVNHRIKHFWNISVAHFDVHYNLSTKQFYKRPVVLQCLSVLNGM